MNHHFWSVFEVQFAEPWSHEIVNGYFRGLLMRGHGAGWGVFRR